MLPDLLRRFAPQTSRKPARARRPRRPSVEPLEDRAVPAVAPVPFPPPPVYHHPIIVFSPFQSAAPPAGALIPSQIRHAYCIDQVSFQGVPGDGRGQTIAIIDAMDDPNIANDLHQFDLQFGIPDPPSFVKLDQNGGNNLPPPATVGSGQGDETSLDVEWAHAVAPMANIVLFEANTLTPGDLFTAVDTARHMPGVVAVSMSFGGGEDQPTEQQFDPIFTTPAGHTGVTFLASTGDSGAPGGYPAFSPNIVAVGGTTLNVDATGNYMGESGWSGSGGGISQFEPQPAFQKGVVTQSSNFRTIPDVSLDADPATGVAVYDSYDNGAATPWEQVGGTSFSCPAWAGIIAVVDQGRVQFGRQSLDGATQTLPALYQIAANPTQYARDFHDITTGNNGFNAGPGYDLVTGIGTPIACNLIPDLVGPPPPAAPTLTLNRVLFPFRYVFSNRTQLYSGHLTLIFTSNVSFTGPLAVLFTRLPPGVTLANANGAVGRIPFISLPSSITPGMTVLRINIQFRNHGHHHMGTFYRGLPVQILLGLAPPPVSPMG